MLKSKMIAPFFLILFLGLLVGCNPIGPRVLNTDRFYYNKSMHYSNNQELLLNIVRLRYDETPFTLKVGNISGSTTLYKAASVSGSVYKKYLSNLISMSSDMRYTDNPIISYTPLVDQDFTKAFLTPITLADIALLMDSSWSISRLMRVALQRAGKACNALSSARSTSSHVPEYQNFIDVASVLRRMQVHDALMGSYFSDKGVDNLIVKIDPSYPITAKDRRILNTAGIELYNNTIVFSNQPGPHKTQVITRSMLGMMNYLSKGLILPPEDIKNNSVTVTRYPDGKIFNWQRVVNGMMKIYFSVKPPKNTLVSVEYRNRWYYISDSDTNSKQTLILLSNIAGLIQVAPNGSGTPPSLARAIISS